MPEISTPFLHTASKRLQEMERDRTQDGGDWRVLRMWRGSVLQRGGHEMRATAWGTGYLIGLAEGHLALLVRHVIHPAAADWRFWYFVDESRRGALDSFYSYAFTGGKYGAHAYICDNPCIGAETMGLHHCLYASPRNDVGLPLFLHLSYWWSVLNGCGWATAFRKLSLLAPEAWEAEQALLALV